jgi:hypothetical protein
MSEEQKPLTREDVLKLIAEHGGPEGLDLSGRNLAGIDLSSHKDDSPLDLHGIIMKGTNLHEANLDSANLQKATLSGANLQDARLGHANLQGAQFWKSNLQDAFLGDADLQGAMLLSADLQRAALTGNLQGAVLIDANLQGALMQFAKLQGADLRGATLSKARLYGADISHDTRLENVNWGPKHSLTAKYILGEEREKHFEEAASVYRNLKQWHTNAGIYDEAGRFYYREMEARRKAESWKGRPLWKLWMWTIRLLCGYGERPELAVANAAIIILGLAAAYHFLGQFDTETFPNSLYYSVVSFTAVGYGSWAPKPEGWAKAMGAAEAVIGVFMMALFLVTFTRKMTR